MRPKVIRALIVCAVLLAAVRAFRIVEPTFALTNGGSITSFGVPLTENFDSLVSTGTNLTWTDNSTIPGWYSTRATYNSGTGSSNTGALYSFGLAGAADRALGSVASGGTGTVYQAVRLTNNTGGTISSLDISYAGEQWRNGGNTTAHTLTFQYQVASPGVITGANAPSAGWTTAAALSFTGPIAAATAAALDGNAPSNRVLKAATLTVTVNAGQEIWLRWQDPDDAGNDHGLAIDDFSVTAQRRDRRERSGRHQHDPGKRSEQRCPRLERRHQFQRAGHRQRQRVRHSVPDGLAAGVRPERVARQLLHADALVTVACRHDMHGDGLWRSDQRYRRERSARFDGRRRQLLVHDGEPAAGRRDAT